MGKFKIRGFDIVMYACLAVALYNNEFMAAIGMAQLLILTDIADSIKGEK